MYTEFFGLQALPFNLTPDPGFLFLPPKHREAITGLSYAIVERKGFVVLTGDAGTGKTTILNSVLSRLPETHVLTSVILNPTLTPAEFLENVLLDFGIPDIPASKAQRLWVLQAFLARAHQEDQIVAVIIDEAHKLNFDVLEEIRLLGNYEFGPDKFLQILLLGQTELDHILNQYELRQLKQRIALRLYIDPLSPAQVPEYITFRWGAAGGVGAHPFDAEAMTGILRWSRGVPRLVNAICDTSLLMAYGEGIHVVGVNFVRAAATNLMLLDTVEEPVNIADSSCREDRCTPEQIRLERIQPVRALDPSLETNAGVPSLLPYGRPRTNLSLLRRLAGKFGFQH
jgi:general secretion pathway protein A